MNWTIFGKDIPLGSEYDLEEETGNVRVWCEDPWELGKAAIRAFCIFSVIYLATEPAFGLAAFLFAVFTATAVVIVLGSVEHYLLVDHQSGLLLRVRRLGVRQMRSPVLRLDRLLAVAPEPVYSRHWSYRQCLICHDGTTLSFTPGNGHYRLDVANLLTRCLAGTLQLDSYRCDYPEDYLKVEGRGRNLTVSYSQGATHWPLHHVVAAWCLAGAALGMGVMPFWL
jgi:hypothetical protein